MHTDTETDAGAEVLGRRGDGSGPSVRFGRHRARDGSDGAPVAVDVDRPHAALVVGKRGYGKSYTLGVLAEGAARASGIAPVVVDPMGVFDGLAASATDGPPVPARVVRTPRVRADAVPPSAWPTLVGCNGNSPVGSVVWRAAAATETLAAMREFIADADAPAATVRAAGNRLSRAEAWAVFDPDGLDADELAGGEATVLDVSSLDPAPMNAAAYAVASGLYDARVSGTVDRLPWLFLDEAHAFFDGVAGPALETILTRGRAPGVSLVAATQRPSALPDVAVSQADLRVIHRLTAGPDIDALAAANPTYLGSTLRERLPAAPGEALVVDDAAEAVRDVTVRRRHTPHGGASPRASDASPDPTPTETEE
ncbi:ATP-binding protein [Halopelagius fulvigenes]|uniref:ATP-binding protein n=1 Tax=Halopelagius fulvigenes TaxID=1198324 RepID=A0ABD5U6K5_9EURY